VLWAIIALGTLLIGASLPVLNVSLRVTSLSLMNWALVLGVAFVATFWMELKKLLKL
jgi:hypothetical protein